MYNKLKGTFVQSAEWDKYTIDFKYNNLWLLG